MRDKDCIFCKIVNGEIPSVKVYEDNNTSAFFDINPVSEYHTLVIPKNHYENIFDIPEEELKQVIATVKKIAVRYKDKLGINNIQILNSNGREAQQEVLHIHFHIIPRKAGDGQNIVMEKHPEWREKFDQWLKRLNK